MPAFWIEDTGTDLILHNKYGQYSKQELETQLKEGHLTADELGEIYHLNTSRIVHVLRSLCITYRNSVEDSRVANFKITPVMHQVLLGTLMGDAYMRDPQYYGLGHSINQMDYLYDVVEQLSPVVPSITYKECKFGKSLEFWTNHHSLFVPYFYRFYSKGKKKKFFTERTAPDIEPAGLAYWYMDDGKYNEYGAYLCVGNISEEEGSVLISFLKNKFNIESTFQNQDIEKGYYNIYIKAESRSHFFSLIDPYVIPTMRYKLTGEKYPVLESKERIVERHLEICRGIEKSIRFSGNKEIEDAINLKQEVYNPKKEYIEKIQEIMDKRGQISYTNMRKVPPDEEMIKLFESDLTNGDIAQKLGFGRNRIAGIRKRLQMILK